MLIGGLLFSVALMYIFAWIDPLTKALRDFTRDTVGDYARYIIVFVYFVAMLQVVVRSRAPARLIDRSVEIT